MQSVYKFNTEAGSLGNLKRHNIHADLLATPVTLGWGWHAASTDIHADSKLSFPGINDLEIGLPMGLLLDSICGEDARDQMRFEIYQGPVKMNDAHACKDLRLSGHSHLGSSLAVCSVRRSYAWTQQR